jgi:hypothetical protein
MHPSKGWVVPPNAVLYCSVLLDLRGRNSTFSLENWLNLQGDSISIQESDKIFKIFKGFLPTFKPCEISSDGSVLVVRTTVKPRYNDTRFVPDF